MNLFWQRLFNEVHSVFQAGGWVMIPILLVGVAGFYCLFNVYLRVHDAKALRKKGNFANVPDESLLEIMQNLDKGMHLAGVMATTAPLLGLLGTVTGMVATFQIITLYGSQNPVLMADGISEALITTQSGLIIAFPLVLLKQRLSESIRRVTKSQPYPEFPA
jgi:biopolymer transport protein ExbB